MDDLFYPSRPVEPERPAWYYRYGAWPTIVGTMAVSTGSAVGASFASGGLLGRGMGLTAGGILGYSVGTFISDALVTRLCKGQPSRRALHIGRGVAYTACLGVGWALAGTRLPDEFVVGPGVPALFVGMFSGIKLAFEHIDPVTRAYDDELRAYQKELEEYEAAMRARPEPLPLEQNEDYVLVGDIQLARQNAR